MKSGLNVNYLDKEIFGEIWTIGFKKHITFTEKIKQLNYVKLIETNKKKIIVTEGPPVLRGLWDLRKTTLCKNCVLGL
jgi:hypothetical protein